MLMERRNFAENVGLKFYTPEEFFLREVPRPFTRSFEPSKFIPESAVSEATLQSYAKLNAQDIVLFCGSPGAGKSTFYWKQLEPLGYARINQDLLKTVRPPAIAPTSAGLKVHRRRSA